MRKLTPESTAALCAVMRHLDRSIDASFSDKWGRVLEYYAENRYLDLIKRFLVEICRIPAGISFLHISEDSQPYDIVPGRLVRTILLLRGMFTRVVYLTDIEIVYFSHVIRCAIIALSSKEAPDVQSRFELRLKLCKSRDIIRKRFWNSRRAWRAEIVDHFNYPLHIEVTPLKDFINEALGNCQPRRP